jgi:mRNA-degrading endonuclease RelE of RelBE toxin-antitoxin system
MAEVEITEEALTQLAEVPRPVQRRIRDVFVRLAQWPDVSGLKRLRGKLAGSYRVRTGDYRIVFRIEEQAPKDVRLVIWKIGYRGDVYD